MRTNRVLPSFLALVVLSVAGFGADSLVETWKLNLAKSKYSPSPAPKSGTLKFEAWGDDGLKISVDGIDAEGKPTHIEYAAKFDGKDYPIKGLANGDTISVKRIDAKNMESVTKKSGKVVMNTRVTISLDGKTRTSVQKGKDAQGRDVNNTVVYDRVK